MFDAWKGIFTRSARFALLCPLLFCIPLAVELLQHWAEVHIGMYHSLASAQAVEQHPLRMGIGHAKIFSLFLIGYCAMRFFGFGDRREASRFDPRAARPFAWVIAWALFWTALLQDGPILADALGLPAQPVMRIVLALVLVTMFFETCLSAWKAAAALGNDRIGFLRSIAMIRGSFLWGTALLLLTVLPLLILHYVCAFAAIGAPSWRLWTILLADSLLTAYLGVVMVALNYTVAERMAARHDEPLLPAQSGRSLTPALG